MISLVLASRRVPAALIVRPKAGLIEGMSRKQSRRQKKEEKILDEVRERVIRESMNLKEKESIRQAREAELEALKEISDLPNRRIQEIDREVRSGFKKKKIPGKSRKVLRTEFHAGGGCRWSGHRSPVPSSR